ncbi:MAG TPA: CBS domain-containing protein [Thermoanaerobaculia bacterium]|nr:CBS domain-containing protein [Thermoanaerobaculia bacterium]
MRPITAGDLMNPEILTVEADMTVRELAAFLVENEISGAPVQDDEGRIVGVVSLVDIAAVHSEGDEDSQRTGTPFARGRASEPDGDGGGDGLMVADVMTPMVYSVTEDATVSEVASAMLKGHLHRVLVTREDRAVGIISTSDLLGLLVTND